MRPRAKRADTPAFSTERGGGGPDRAHGDADSAAEWRATTLAEVIEGFESGRSISAAGRPASAGEVGVLKISAVTWGEFQPEENKALPAHHKARAHEFVRGGDLLITRANTTDLVGAVALVSSERLGGRRLVLPDKVLRILPKADVVSPEYLLFALRTPEVRAHFADNATGTSDSMRNLSQPKLAAAPILLPPLADQLRIVARIKALLPKVIVAQERLGRVRELLKRFRQSVLAAACSGRLTQDWRQSTEPFEHSAVILQGARRARFEQGNDGGQADPNEAEIEDPALPSGWTWHRVSDIARVGLGGTPSRKISAYWGGHTAWVSSGEVSNCRISGARESITAAGLENSNAKVYPPGTVLIDDWLDRPYSLASRDS